MANELLIVIVLVLFYLTECVQRFDGNTVVLISYNYFNWNVIFKGFSKTIREFWILIKPPLPPVADIFACRFPTFYFSPMCIYSLFTPKHTYINRTTSPPLLFHYEEIREIRVKTQDIVINNQIFARCQTRAIAIKLASFLQKLIPATILKREEMITEFLKRDFSKDVAKEKLYHYRYKSIVLTFLRNSLFLYLFMFLPYLILRYGFENVLIKYITGLIPILLSISILQHKIHKYFFPDDAHDRLASSIKAFLYPPYSIRVSDFTSHNMFAEYHPIVPASIILKRRKFEQFCKEILVDLNYPNYSYLLNGELVKADSWHRNAIIKLLNEYLEEEGINTQALLKPPKRFDNTCKSYCPRCGNQYDTARESCSDCSDIKLIFFTSGS